MILSEKKWEILYKENFAHGEYNKTFDGSKLIQESTSINWNYKMTKIINIIQKQKFFDNKIISQKIFFSLGAEILFHSTKNFNRLMLQKNTSQHEKVFYTNLITSYYIPFGY